MRQAVSSILSDRERLLGDVAAGRRLGAHWAWFATITAAGAAAYGAVLGSWQGPRLALYDAAKLPLVLVSTSALTIGFHWIIARLLGVPLELRQVGALNALALAIGAVLLASLAPVVMLFTWCWPPPVDRNLFTYDLLYVLHVAVMGGASLAGTTFLWRTLRRIACSPAAGARIYFAWTTVSAFVGAEVGWALRPFIGSPWIVVAFIRPDAFHGNAYEALLTAIRILLPHR